MAHVHTQPKGYQSANFRLLVQAKFFRSGMTTDLGEGAQHPKISISCNATDVGRPGPAVPLPRYPWPAVALTTRQSFAYGVCRIPLRHRESAAPSSFPPRFFSRNRRSYSSIFQGFHLLSFSPLHLSLNLFTRAFNLP